MQCNARAWEPRHAGGDTEMATANAIDPASGRRRSRRMRFVACHLVSDDDLRFGEPRGQRHLCRGCVRRRNTPQRLHNDGPFRRRHCDVDLESVVQQGCERAVHDSARVDRNGVRAGAVPVGGVTIAILRHVRKITLSRANTTSRDTAQLGVPNTI